MKERILIQDPDIQSRAALVMLRRQLMLQDAAKWSYWLRFRRDLLEARQADGPLMCYHCGAGPLPITDEDYEKVATLDHYIPLARGGARYDPGNLVVSCWPCNERKADSIPLTVRDSSKTLRHVNSRR